MASGAGVKIRDEPAGKSKSSDLKSEDEREIKFMAPGITEERLLAIGATRVKQYEIADQYFKSIYNGTVVRVRNENGQYYLMLKAEDIAADNLKDRIEYSVSTDGGIGEMLAKMGYKEKVRILKSRTRYKLDDLSIDINATSLLGNMLEIEYEKKSSLAMALQKLGLRMENAEKRSTYQLLCETQLGEFDSFDRAAQEIASKINQLAKERPNETILVGISGSSGAGKSFLAQRVAKLVGASVLSLDRYYKEDTMERVKLNSGNFDDPALIEFDLIRSHMRMLKEGRPIQQPIYSFASGKREGYEEFICSHVTIVEGIFAFYPDAGGKNNYDLTVSVHSDVHLNLLRRLARDAQRTSLSPDQIINQVSWTVFPMYKINIEPYLRGSDITVFSKFDPRSSTDGELQVKFKETDAPTIRGKVTDYGMALGSVHQKDFVLLPPEGDVNDTIQVRYSNDQRDPTLSFKLRGLGESWKKTRRYECKVDYSILGALAALRYEVIEIVEKDRSEFTYNGLRVRFDSVDGLGDFIELASKREESLKAAAARLGIDPSKSINSSYAEMMLAQRKQQ